MIRRKPLQPGTKRMKSRRRAIGAATVAEQAQQDSQRRKGCAVCRLLDVDTNRAIHIHHRTVGDLHGNKQLGQGETVALCAWHHAGELGYFPTVAGMLAHYGPSLHHHKRAFLAMIAERLGERSTAALQRWQDAQPDPN